MKQNTIIGLISLSVVIVIGFFVFNNAKVPVLGGSTEAVGDYAIKTSGHTQIINYSKAVLHKIVFGTANDAVCIADSASSASGCTLITATVPDEFDFEMNLESGLTANVTSTNGVIFITSPR